jgi:flagellar basal body-associated protein FliL
VSIAIIAVIVVLLVLGFGLLIFWLMRRSQDEVPDIADAHAARHPQVVGTDERGRAITDADEPEAAPRDAGAFEGLLKDEIHDLGHEQPAADDD